MVELGSFEHLIGRCRESLLEEIGTEHPMRFPLMTLLEYVDNLESRCHYLQAYCDGLEKGLEELKKSILHG